MIVTTDKQIPRVELATMPMEAAAEVLMFMAEREELTATKDALGEAVELGEIRAMLRELAVQLRKIAAVTPAPVGEGAKHLNNRAKKLMSCLSPHEEKTLLRAFGLIDRR